MDFSAIRIIEYSFCFNCLGLYLPFALRTILTQANQMPTFLTFDNIMFMFNFTHKVDVCCILLHTLEVTLQLVTQAVWYRIRNQILIHTASWMHGVTLSMSFQLSEPLFPSLLEIVMSTSSYLYVA